ncbi:unnamed protein product [Toxocara canis]|nr:unnamed protein product [Toxocara canis]
MKAALLLLSLLGVVRKGASIDLITCDTCVAVINGVMNDEFNDFSQVTPSQLLNQLIVECENNTWGGENTECQQWVSDNLVTILQGLQAGDNGNSTCSALGVC